jgi:serine/threonine-protein phosphatase PGAM5
MGKRFVYLVRHGDYGPEGNHDEEFGYGLTPRGIRQAQAIANRLKSFPVSAIYTSRALRATETAAIIAVQLPEAPLYITKDLGECIPCIPRGLKADPSQWPPDQIERDYKRAEKVLVKYFKCTRGSDRHDVIVAHGNLMRYLICRLLDQDGSAWLQLGFCNCGLSEVLVLPDGVKILKSHNDVGHLARTLRTHL